MRFYIKNLQVYDFLSFPLLTCLLVEIQEEIGYHLIKYL